MNIYIQVYINMYKCKCITDFILLSNPTFLNGIISFCMFISLLMIMNIYTCVCIYIIHVCIDGIYVHLEQITYYHPLLNF